MGASKGGTDRRDNKKEERRKKAASGGSKGGGGGGSGGGGGGRGGRESKTQKVRVVNRGLFLLHLNHCSYIHSFLASCCVGIHKF